MVQTSNSLLFSVIDISLLTKTMWQNKDTKTKPQEKSWGLLHDTLNILISRKR